MLILDVEIVVEGYSVAIVWYSSPHPPENEPSGSNPLQICQKMCPHLDLNRPNFSFPATLLDPPDGVRLSPPNLIILNSTDTHTQQGLSITKCHHDNLFNLLSHYWPDEGKY